MRCTHLARGSLLACLLVALPMVLSAPLAAPADIVVTHRARSIQPGEVVVLIIDSARPLKEARVSAFGRSFPCFEGAAPTKWLAIVGIDLDTKSGRQVVRITGVEAGGMAVTVQHPLIVVPKSFPTRSLTVDPRFVSPPPEALPRIEKEAERVRAILAAVSPERHWSGPFIFPVPGRPISEFGKRSVYNGQARSPHSGTDFAGAAGTPVKAPNAGRVVLAADLYYSGNTIILDHGQGLYSYFGHLSAFSASEGDMVAAGDVVGKVGATGLVTGPHLHWAVRLAGTRVDPLSLVAVLSSLH